MDLPIIITHKKKSKDRWLSKNIKYEKDFENKEVINEMLEEIEIWISNKKDLKPTINYEEFKSKFINLLYDKYSF
jgi:hypothetical protein